MKDQIGVNQLECPDFNTLAAYLDDSLDEKEKQRVDSHIQRCERCREIFNFGERARHSQAAHVPAPSRNDELSPLVERLMPFGQLSTGETIGRYIVVKPLGLGGMGEVYSAYDPELNRRVALKLLRTDVYAKSDINESVSRLMKEAQAMAQLSHPNVISIYDVMKVHGQIVIAMEYFSGGTLKSWLREQTRYWREIVDVFVSAGQGLAAAHAAKLIHRDFKPSNVLLDYDGRVCVTDFGLVRGIDQEELNQPSESLAPSHRLEDSLTKSGVYIGTPAYMSPEQMLGEKSDTRSDQFCFCVALFEALYGIRPYQGETFEEIKESIFSGQIAPVDPSKDVPAWLYGVIKRGIDVKPEDRHPSMDYLLAELKHDPEEEERKRRVLRNRRLGWLTLILLAVILPIGIWYGLRYRTVQLCKDISQEFVGVWDNTTKESIKKAFLASGKTYAQGTWERVARNFEKYLNDWNLMRSDICEAKHIRGTQSDELFDLRMSCLKERKQELKALSKVFTKADSKIVGKAVQASSSFTGIRICADEKALRENYPQPKTKEQKTIVSAIREKLAEVKALEKTGKYRDGLELAKKIEKEVSSVDYQPLQAEVLFWVGLLLNRTGEYRKAESKYYDATRVAGESRDALLAAKATTKLAWVVGFQQGRHKEGMLLAKSAETMLHIAGGDELTLADLFHGIGVIYRGMGKYDKALEYISKSLAIEEKMLGPDHPNVAGLLGNIGISFAMQGKYDKALEYMHRTLVVYERALGSAHPNVAKALINLGTILEHQGKYFNSSQYYRRALAVFEKVLGPEHRHVATVLNNLGNVFHAQSEHDKALEYYRRALAIREKALGLDHPEVAASLNNIGLVFEKQRKYDQALVTHRRALAIREKALGLDHPEVAASLNNVGLVFEKQGKYDQALHEHRRALAINEKTLGSEHPDVALSLNNIAVVFEKQKKYDQALENYRKALAIREKALGSEHPDVVTSLQNLGNVFRAQGDYTKALENYRRALAVREKIWGPEHQNVTKTLGVIGDFFVAQGSPAKAIKPLERLTTICKKKKCDPEAHGEGLFALARALMATGGDKKRAVRLAKQARGVFGKTPKAFKKQLKDLDNWLNKHDR